MTDNVNHPKHYTQGGVECIDALAAATINLQGIDAVCTANAIKYLWRWGQKNGVEDKTQAEEKQFFMTAVHYNLNMWRDSGDVDYLYKAIAYIKAQIGVEEKEA